MSFFEKLVSAFFWLQILLCPFLPGAVIGFFLWQLIPGTAGEVAGIATATLGLAGGILFAEYIRRKHGTAEFMSRILGPDPRKKN